MKKFLVILVVILAIAIATELQQDASKNPAIAAVVSGKMLDKNQPPHNSGKLQKYSSGHPITIIPSLFKGETAPYSFSVTSKDFNNDDDISMSFWFRWSWVFPSQARYSGNQWIPVAQVSETGSCGTAVGDQLLSFQIKPDESGQPAYSFSTYTLQGQAKSLFIQTDQVAITSGKVLTPAITSGKIQTAVFPNVFEILKTAVCDVFCEKYQEQVRLDQEQARRVSSMTQKEREDYLTTKLAKDTAAGKFKTALDKYVECTNGQTATGEVCKNGETQNSGSIQVTVPLVDNNDFDGSWNWLYMGYNRQSKQVYIYTQLTQSNKIVSALVQHVVHRASRPKLFFSLGKCNSAPFQFNGHFFDQRFEYSGKNFRGSRSEVQAFLRDIVLKPPQITLSQAKGAITFVNANQAYSNNRVISATDTIIQADGDKKKVEFDFVNATGPLEYAIYGWAKWQKSNLDGPQNLFRLTIYDSAAEQDNTKPGDRLLGAQIIKVSGKEKLQLQTFNFKYSFDPAAYQSSTYDIDAADDLTNWVWIYASYNFPLSKVSFFVQLYTRNIQWEQSYESIMPFRLRGSIGGSNFGSSFVGSIQDWCVDWGSGAFINKNYLSLQKFDPFSIKNQSKIDTVVVPTEQKILDNSKNIIIDAGGSTDPRVEPTAIKIPEANVQTVKSFAFYFWARTTFDQLEIQKMAKATKPRFIAGVTETGNLGGSAMGDTALGIFMPPFSQSGNQPCFRFMTYAQNRQNASEFFDIPIDKTELDHNWIWFYFGYNYELQKAFGYVYFNDKGTVKSKEFNQVVHITPLTNLTFQLYDGKTNWPSLITNANFRVDALSFKQNETMVNFFRENYADKSPAPTINSAVFTVVNCVAVYGNPQKPQNLAPIAFYDNKNAFFGAKQYAVWGKFQYSGKFNQITDSGLGIFALNYQDASQQPLLSLKLTKTALVFSASNFDFDSTAAKFKTIEIPITSEDISSQIFFYAGYNGDNSRATIFIQLAKGPQTQNIENLMQQKPSVGHTISLGTFAGTDNFLGTYQNVFAAVGQKSVVTDYQKLLSQRTQCDGDFGENNVQYKSDNSKGSKTFGAAEIKDEDIPKVDKFSYWTWFRFSLSQPTAYPNGVAGVKSNCYLIARVTFTADQGMRGLFCFDANGVPSIKIQDTATTVAPTTIDFPEGEKGIDSWHFIYMSHNNIDGTTFGAVFFKSGTIKVASIANVQWKRPFEFLKFRLAGVIDTNLQFNGYFFDGQFSTTSDTYAAALNDVARVMGVVTQSPPVQSNPILLPGGGVQEFKIAEGNSTLISCNETKTVLVFKEITDYENPQQYSISGFFKLNQVEQNDNYTVIYRFSSKKQNAITNDKAFGDRVFQLGLTQSGDLIADTYNSSTQDGKGFFVLSNVAQQVKKDDRWSFFVHSYNGETNQVNIYIKFADGVEFNKTVYNVYHDSSEVFTYFIGKDNFYNGFNGQVRDVIITFGYDQTKKDMTARKDSAINEKQTKTSGNTVSDKPLDQSGDCIIVYQKCQYLGQSQTLCAEDPQINFIIGSIYVPPKQAVRIFGDNMYNGRYQDFYASNPCITNGGTFMLQNKFKITYNNQKLDDDIHTVNIIRETSFVESQILPTLQETSLLQSEESEVLPQKKVVANSKATRSHAHEKPAKHHTKHLKANLKL